MAFQDFRDFLDALRKHGELIDIDRPVAHHLEVAKARRKSAVIGGPACLFKNNGTRFPLVAGVYNSRAKALIALEATEDATFSYGTVVRKAGDASKICGPALAEHGLEYVEVADVPGWQDYDFPELRRRGAT